MKVLIIEDEKLLADSIRSVLERSVSMMGRAARNTRNWGFMIC